VDLLTATVAQRPDLAPLLGDFNPWPQFMHQDPVGSLYYADPVTAYPEFVLVAVDRDHPDQLVAKGYSVPFTWDEDPAESLPEDGWDGVILSAAIDRFADRRGNLVSALEISVRHDFRGRGVSGLMLAAMLHNAAAFGFPSWSPRSARTASTSTPMCPSVSTRPCAARTACLWIRGSGCMCEPEARSSASHHAR